ncbi:thioredoxin [Pasteurella multocida]|uniref:thioredoxin n=1 Tax=Pasteurella multocida TaxID=747 RepID=UPI00397C6A53
MMEVLHSTDTTFTADVVNSDIPVLLDFWAPWCGPCRMISPILDEIAAEFSGKVKVVKINIDENQATPAQLGVRSIPTLVLFKNGKAVATQVGALPKNQLANFINQNI